MSWMEIATEDRRFVFAPGDEIRGTIAWHLDSAPASVELSLLWYTEGRGDQDIGVVESRRFDAPGAEDRREFRFQVPDGPLSFSGKLISLAWALEAVVEPGGESQRLEVLVSATGGEIRLGSVEPDLPPMAKKLVERLGREDGSGEPG